MTQIKVQPFADVGHGTENFPTHVLAVKLKRLIEAKGFLGVSDQLFLNLNVGEVMIELESFFLSPKSNS